MTALRAARTDVAARFVAACLVGFSGTWNVSNVGALALPLSRHYHSSLAVIGLFTTGCFVGELTALIPSGVLIDRFGAKRVGLGGLVICLAGNGLLLLVPGAGLAVFVRMLTGLGVGASFLAGSAYARTGSQSALFQGLYGGMSLAAGGCALAVVPQLSNALDWRAPYLSGLVVAGAGIVFVTLAPSTRPLHGRSPVVLPKLALDRRLAHLGMLSTASFGASIVIGNWAPTLLVRAHGYSKGTAGVVAGLTVLLGIVGRPIGGIVTRRAPDATRLVIVVSFLAGVVGTVVMALGAPLAAMVLAAIAIGIAGGTPFGPIMFAATRVYPEAPGAAVGAMNVYPAAAIVLVTPLIGLTFGLPGDGRVGFIVLAALWAVAAWTAPPNRVFR
jgi:MFS family permease